MTFSGFGVDAYKILKAIEFHQSREWFAENRALYECALREPLLAFCAEAARRVHGAGLEMRFDPRRGPFRINRDVRFSKDKRPYNTHVSAVLSRDGSKSCLGVLYVHVGLDRQFFAAGYWALPKAELTRFRRHIATFPKRFHLVHETLSARGLAMSHENALKRLPRGFDEPGDAMIADALRQRGYTVSESFPAGDAHSAVLLDRFEAFATRAKPLLDWGGTILA